MTDAGFIVPEVVLPRNLSDLEAKCDEHLSRLGISVWGRAFDVNDPKGRAAAAEWFATQIVALHEGPEWLRG